MTSILDLEVTSPASSVPYTAPDAPRGEGHVDQTGLDRSLADRAAATAAGFTTAETVYDRGSRVIEAGVTAARRSRVEFESLPSVGAACAALQETIAAEDRKDLHVLGGDVAMTDVGSLLVHRNVGTVETAISAQAFTQMVNRLGYGGSKYLLECPLALRAANVNAQRELREDVQTTDLKLRTRGPAGERSVFAALSQSYTAYDADRIAGAIAAASPAGARAEITYDGEKTRMRVLLQTTVQPEDFVAGEFFRAGVIVTTDDTGRGGVRLSPVVWQNLCLNLIIIDEAHAKAVSIAHIGNELLLARKFRDAFDASLRAIGHFTKVWGYACRDDVSAKAKGAPVVMSEREVVRGLFAGLIKSDKLTAWGSKAQRVEIVDELTANVYADTSSATVHTRTSRAALANAITRFAHTRERRDATGDLWIEDVLQREAGKLVASTAALSYVDPLELSGRVEAFVD